jgi:hypothetical protein
MPDLFETFARLLPRPSRPSKPSTPKPPTTAAAEADARRAKITEKIEELKKLNARITDVSSQDFETQEAYNARKLRNAEGLIDVDEPTDKSYVPTPEVIKKGYLWNTKVSLKRNLTDSSNKIIDELLAKAAKVNLNSTEVDQVNTIKRIYTMLQIRAQGPAEYEAKLNDYSKLLQGYFKATEDKKGWFRTTKGRNTFKYLRNAQANTTRTKIVETSVKIQQMHAYNEILGLILALTAKAHNKYQSKTTFEWLLQRSKERLTARGVKAKDRLKDEKSNYDLLNSYVTKYDSDAGIYSLSTISAEYVYDIVASGKVRKLLNLREELSASLKNAKDKVSWMSMLLWRGAVPLGVAAVLLVGLTSTTVLRTCPPSGLPVQDFTGKQVSCPVAWSRNHWNSYCSCKPSGAIYPYPTTRQIEVGRIPPVIGSDVLQQIKGAFSIDALSAVNQQLYDFALALQTHFLNLIPGVLPVVSEAIGLGLSYGLPTAAMLTYRTVKGAQKTGTFKKEFIELHKILFNEANKITFEDATQRKDLSGNFFVFDQLLPMEQEAINTFKNVFKYGDVSDDDIKKYLEKMLEGGQKRQVRNLLSDVPPEQASIFIEKARKEYPNIVGWDLSYNPITQSFTYDCASDPRITAWPEPGDYSILNTTHCTTCKGAKCPPPRSTTKRGGYRRPYKTHRKTRRKET